MFEIAGGILLAGLIYFVVVVVPTLTIVAWRATREDRRKARAEALKRAEPLNWRWLRFVFLATGAAGVLFVLFSSP